MAITLMCPNLSCRSVLRVPDKVRGKKVRCGQCGTVFGVPAAPAQKTPTKAPAAESPPAKKG